MNIQSLREDLRVIDAGEDNEGGLVLGDATTSKVGFFGATPVVQPTNASQAALGAMTGIGANDQSAGIGLSSIGNTADVHVGLTLMSNLCALQEDINALANLTTEIRTALVNTGIMKGS